MNVGLTLCFESGSQLNDLYRKLFEQYVHFIPNSTTFNGRVKKWDQKADLPLLESCDSNKMLGFSANNNVFLYSIIRRNHPFRIIEIVQDSDSFLPKEDEISLLSDRPGFIAGFVYNEDYECIQSTPPESNYANRVFSNEILSSIKSTPYETNEFGQKRYHTKFNPGRSVSMDYLKLLVSWRMWFGKDFFKLVPKEKIVSFPYATAIMEISSDLVYVQLYDSIEEPFTAESVFRQWKWREWLDYDGLESKYKF